MARVRRSYECMACGFRTPSYTGRCPTCQAWNTLEAVSEAPPAARGGGTKVPAALLGWNDVAGHHEQRLPTEIEEFDRVLGSGLVPGGVVLVGGEPGIGKSTLMLQVADRVAREGRTVAYVCGEESPRQVRSRGARIGIAGDGIKLIGETSIDAALAAIEQIKPSAVIVDSIQSMTVDELQGRSGGPAQLTECGARLVSWAKQHEVATLMTGHVTKTGDIAGPRLLEHAVDAVLYFETAGAAALRILRSVKNRFGTVDEVGVFEMTSTGLTSVDNPSAAFLDLASLEASGCAASAVIEGTRPLAVEIQALAVPSHLATPRRTVYGIEAARLHLLLAVLSRRASLHASDRDVVVSVAGGLRLRDTGIDLAVLGALASAIVDEPLRPGIAFLGEVSLSGRIRQVPQVQRRLAEFARVGIGACIAAPGTLAAEGVEIIEAETVRDAMALALPGRRRARSAGTPGGEE